MNKSIAYIGTYTNGASEGIYRLCLDTDKGNIEDLSVVARFGNPTYLCIHNNKLYTVGNPLSLDTLGGVASYNIEEDYSLKLTGASLLQGKKPCHINIIPDKSLIVSSNYHEKSINTYSLNENFDIDTSLSAFSHKDDSKMHFASITPDNKFICAVNLGMDRIELFKINSNNTLSYIENLSFYCTKGCGPRHIEFSKNGKFAYVICENSSEIIILKYLGEEGFKLVQYIHVLPNGFGGQNFGSAIKISPCNKFLYVSNRGFNGISAFRINQETGSLSLINHYSSHGDFPRDFEISPCNKFLIIANEKSDNLTIYLKNPDGTLKLFKNDIFIPSPTCIKFK